MNANTSLDRRSGLENRSLDLGPPRGQNERRQQPERRRPKVRHFEFDEHVELQPVSDTPNDIH